MARKIFVKICMMALGVMFLLTGCVTVKDKAGLKLSEKKAAEYYSDKYGESAKVVSSEFYSYRTGGVGLPDYTVTDEDSCIYKLDNGVTVVYDKEKGLYFDDKQTKEISDELVRTVLKSYVENTGWDYRFVYPGGNDDIRFTQSFVRQAFHDYYDGDIWKYVENAEAEIISNQFYKIYFRMTSQDGWQSTLDKFIKDMDTINGLNYMECFGVWSYDDEDTIENVANSVWSYNKDAKLPLAVNNFFDVADVRVYFTTYGRALDDADRAGIHVEDASALIDTYNGKLDHYKLYTGGRLYRVQMDIDFGKYDINWDLVEKKFVYSGYEGVLAFSEDSDGDIRSARYSSEGDWEYFPLSCGKEFFVYIGTFER